MSLGPASYALGTIAGALSTLSPCVLPLIPVVVASAVGAHRRGPWALALGLTLSFAILGTFLAFAAGSLGLSTRVFQVVAAVLLGVFGLLLLSGSLQQRYAAAASGLGNAGHGLLDRIQPEGLSGQFLVGLVLGVIWSPCVGPTLGAAIGLASQGRDLGSIALLMALFGVGASVPLLVLGLLSRAALGRIRNGLLRGGRVGKAVLGVFLLATAVSMLSGADQRIESWLVDHSPAWLTHLTTQY